MKFDIIQTQEPIGFGIMSLMIGMGLAVTIALLFMKLGLSF